MKRIKAFGAFWYDFVIGDDWRVAVGVALALGLTLLLAHHSTIAVWWILPGAVFILMPVSVYRITRRSR